MVNNTNIQATYDAYVKTEVKLKPKEKAEIRRKLVLEDKEGELFQKPKYESLKDFLYQKDPLDYRPEVYDFKKQFDAQYIIVNTWEGKKTKKYGTNAYNDYIKYFLENRTDDENSIIAELNYKGQNDLPGQKVTFDCDGSGNAAQGNLCWLAREIYRLLWNWKDSDNLYIGENINKDVKLKFYEQCGSMNIEMGPDTMNSFLTTFNIELKNSLLEFYKKKTFQLGNENLWELFAKLTSCLGNFVIVPSYFNPMRGIDSEIKDYWDLSLNYLKEKENFYYKRKKINWQKTLFKRYINTFFLWDYCYIPVEGKYMVKSLLSSNFKDIKYNEMNQTDSHSMYWSEEKEGRVYPTKEEISVFLENVNWAIERRGIFMVAMLKIALLGRDENCEWNVSPIYKKLMEKVLQEENCYESYTAVFSKIVEILNQEEKSAIKDIVLSAAEKLVCKEDLERIQKLF